MKFVPSGRPLATEDYIRVQNLYARFAAALDLGDIDAWVSCFTSDGEFGAAGNDAESESAGFTVKGSEALREQAQRMAGNPEAMAYHWHVNPVLIATETGATGLCYFLFITAPGGRGEISVAGHYEDELAKVNDEWLIRRRIIHTTRKFGEE